jgi:RNA polymerase sigma factor for flagellar operon FliA
MTEAQQAYAAKLPAHDEQRQALIMELLPQVRYIARHIHERLPQHILLEDLVHAGILGLLDAVEKFDPRKNVQIKSYAKFRIRGAILDSLRELDWSPRELRRQARHIEQAYARLRAVHGRDPEEHEVAAELDLPLDEFQRLLGELRGLDLGSIQTDNPEDTREDELCTYIPYAPEEDPFFVCAQGEMKEILAKAIDELSPKERDVLSLYYFEELTMKEVGAVIGVVESRVSQIHSAAIVKLRSHLAELLKEREPKKEVAVQRPRKSVAGAR